MNPLFGTTPVHFPKLFRFDNKTWVCNIQDGRCNYYKISDDLNSLTMVYSDSGSYHEDILTNIYDNLMGFYDYTNKIIKIRRI